LAEGFALRPLFKAREGVSAVAFFSFFGSAGNSEDVKPLGVYLISLRHFRQSAQVATPGHYSEVGLRVTSLEQGHDRAEWVTWLQSQLGQIVSRAKEVRGSAFHCPPQSNYPIQFLKLLR